MNKQEQISQTVIVPDILIAELKDRVHAEGLTRRGGVMLHFGIDYSKMSYSRHYRDIKNIGTVWEFSNYPFKVVK